MLHCRCHVLSNSTWSYCSDTVPILFPLVLLQINSAGFCEILQSIQTLKLPLHSSACTGTKMWLLILSFDFDCCTIIAWEQFLTCWVFAPEILWYTCWDLQRFWHGLIPEKAFYVGNAWWTSHTAPDRHYCRCHVQLFDVNLMPSAFTPGCRARQNSTGDAEGALYVLDMSTQKSKWSRVVQGCTGNSQKTIYYPNTSLSQCLGLFKSFLLNLKETKRLRSALQQMQSAHIPPVCLGQAWESQAPPREQAQSLHLEASLCFGRVCI